MLCLFTKSSLCALYRLCLLPCNSSGVVSAYWGVIWPPSKACSIPWPVLAFYFSFTLLLCIFKTRIFSSQQLDSGSAWGSSLQKKPGALSRMQAPYSVPSPLFLTAIHPGYAYFSSSPSKTRFHLWKMHGCCLHKHGIYDQLLLMLLQVYTTVRHEFGNSASMSPLPFSSFPTSVVRLLSSDISGHQVPRSGYISLTHGTFTSFLYKHI